MKGLWIKIHSDNRMVTVFYGAIGSLLATSLLKYSPYLLSWLGEYTFGLLSDFIDSKYAKAATLEPTDYSYFLLALIFIVIVVAWMEMSGKIKRSFNKSVEIDGHKIQKNNQTSLSWMPKAFLLVRVVVWLYLAMGVLYIAGESTVINAITNFKQHVRIISPYIENQEKEYIVSQWSQMRSLEDYNEVYSKLVEIANKNELTLYRNKNY